MAIIYVIVLSRRLKRRAEPQESFAFKLKQFYIRHIINILLDENQPMAIPVASDKSHRRALCEAIYMVMSHTYGSDAEQLSSLVKDNRLEDFILHQVARTREYDRAHWLMVMSCIPLSKNSLRHIEKYLSSKSHATRIAALTALLAAEPQMAIRRIATLKKPLRPIDFVRIVALLRRGILPIAYEPMLESDNYNLQMLGIAIVRNFGIDIADRQLHNIISESNDPAITREAILTLSSLGRPLGRSKIRQRMRAMKRSERKAFCRHLAAEGYSVQALRTLFSEKEMHYAETLIKSYKRELGCPQCT